MLTVANCLLSVAVLLVLLPWIGRNMTKEPSEQRSPEELIRLFCTEYELTPRERDVLQMLLNLEISTLEIAERLGISQRMVQRYIASICEKSGARDRYDVVAKVFPGQR